MSVAAFSGLQHLQILWIESNVLSHAPDLRHISKSLKSLSLITGRFISRPRYFVSCSALRHVSFYNASMADLYWGFADISDHIIELNFALNKLTSLSALYEVYFARLETLQLQNNAIHVINLAKLHLPVLKLLDISRNRLIQLDDPSGLVLGSMLTPDSPMILDIFENPWHCNGTFNWLIKDPCNIENNQHDSTFSTKSGTVLIMAVNILLCESPPNKEGTRVIDDATIDGPSVIDDSTLCGGYTANMS